MIKLRYRRDGGTGIDTGILRLERPSSWISDDFEVACTPWTENEAILDMEGAQLLVDADCNDWTIIFTSGRLYLNEVEVLDGADPMFPASAGPFSISGSGYDSRLNIASHSGSTDEVVVSFGSAPCSDSEPNFDREIAWNSRGGWQHHDGSGFVSEPVLYDLSFGAPSYLGDCRCDVNLIASLAYFDTWDVRLAGELTDSQIRTLAPPITCEGPPGPPITFDPVHNVRRNYGASRVRAEIVSVTHGIQAWQRNGQACCANSGALAGGDCRTVTDSDLDVLTRSTYEKYMDRFLGESWCTPSGGDIICKPVEKCRSRKRLWTEWPETGPCAGGGAGNVHSVAAADGLRHYVYGIT